MADCDMKMQMLGIVFDTCRIKIKKFHFRYLVNWIGTSSKIKTQQWDTLDVSKIYLCNNDVYRVITLVQVWKKEPVKTIYSVFDMQIITGKLYIDYTYFTDLVGIFILLDLKS